VGEGCQCAVARRRRPFGTFVSQRCPNSISKLKMAREGVPTKVKVSFKYEGGD